MNQRPLLKIDRAKGHVVLIVKDFEVFDYVSDVLIEQYDLDFPTFSTEVVNGVETFTLFFPESNILTKLQSAISEIDPDEIQRIWNLNN